MREKEIVETQVVQHDKPGLARAHLPDTAVQVRLVSQMIDGDRTVIDLAPGRSGRDIAGDTRHALHFRRYLVLVRP